MFVGGLNSLTVNSDGDQDGRPGDPVATEAFASGSIAGRDIHDIHIGAGSTVTIVYPDSSDVRYRATIDSLRLLLTKLVPAEETMDRLVLLP